MKPITSYLPENNSSPQQGNEATSLQKVHEIINLLVFYKVHLSKKCKLLVFHL